MIEMLLVVVTIALSLVLAGISFVAYRKSRLRPALYLLLAFLIFALKKMIEALKLTLWVEKDIGLVTGVLEATVLILLLLSLWRR